MDRQSEDALEDVMLVMLVMLADKAIFEPLAVPCIYPGCVCG